MSTNTQTNMYRHIQSSIIGLTYSVHFCVQFTCRHIIFILNDTFKVIFFVLFQAKRTARYSSIYGGVLQQVVLFRFKSMGVWPLQILSSFMMNLSIAEGLQYYTYLPGSNMLSTQLSALVTFSLSYLLCTWNEHSSSFYLSKYNL